MPLVLPEGHPRASLAVTERARRPRVRIGILNIMPRLEAYEPNLLAPLARSGHLIEPVFVRLTTHGYQSSDHAHLDRFYRPYEDVVAEAPLDGLLLTGAPVEELAFEDVHYWTELTDILAHARKNVACTLGLCWGGMALGHVLGVEKETFSKKLFGVFEERLRVAAHDMLEGGSSFSCAQSRHSGLVANELEHAERAGTLRLLAHGEQSGYSMFETLDGRYVAHLGHPEYEGDRLAFEWKRDRDLGRRDVEPPQNFDPESARTTWRAHQDAVFSGFASRAARTARAERTSQPELAATPG